jgi:hypothetical protein
MHIQIIAERSGLFDRSAVEQTAQSISRRTDVVSVRSIADGDSHSFQKGCDVVLIAVFRDKVCVEKPHFSIWIRDAGTSEAENVQTQVLNDRGKRFVCASENVLEVLTTLVATLIGYETVYLTGITVKDMSGCKIKPRIKILVPSLPFFRVEKELKLEKELTATRDDVRHRYLEDMCQVCAVDDRILLSLLSEYDLAFSGSTNLYKLVLREKQVLLIRKERIQQPFLIEMIYQTEARKRLEGLFETNVKGMRKIKDAMLYPFNDDVDMEFYSEITRVAKEKNSKVLDFLHDVVCMCPRLADHRATYIKKIEDIFAKKPREKEARRESTEGEYLCIAKERVIDRTPMGTLKEWYTG